MRGGHRICQRVGEQKLLAMACCSLGEVYRYQNQYPKSVSDVLGRLSLAKSDWLSARRHYEIERKRVEVSRRATAFSYDVTIRQHLDLRPMA